MTMTYKILGQAKPDAVTNTDLYTVPAATSAVCSTLTICNTGASTMYRIAVRPAGAPLEAKHYIVYDATAAQYDATMLTLGITLNAGDVITVYAGSGTVAFGLFGSEIA